MEGTFIKVLKKEEQAQKKILSLIEDDIHEHWKVGCKLLIKYEKNPALDIKSSLEAGLMSLEKKHNHCLTKIREHSRNLKKLKKMLDKINKEITASLYESGSFYRDIPRKTVS